ncbi:DNA-binding response regulator, OmpR family, contains REC and winged-helix (wHTH) domain [Pilibacter termitis]|uniref:DNA-binding response regulator, OmpR family, contains REC and winged-helix (WHTH) domain n=1 Tax=Pilibacter termitis TaxID=263852 RepID=A0A1T4RB25_9ENTE|nr:response regulator transcription factor [Pilibacter termitis]SKA13234.1 DNA-binding response regulator, OmpR family, contains REC and winged-helix (wHTH) domain [Pilibacter termitis]
MKLLIVEDNNSVREMMKMFFKNEGWDVTFAQDGQEGLNTFLKEPNAWDIVTLDLNLPLMDGIEVGRRIREVSKTVPIIMLTARDSDSDQVLGFEVGADDYVTKPFSPITLIARIKALHRRREVLDENFAHQTSQEVAQDDYDHAPIIQTKTLKINPNTREVYVNGKETEKLTPKEFELLSFFATKPKKIFSREQLLELVWDYSFYGDERTVDTHVKKLRQKLGKVGSKIIQTAWGVGYMFDDTDVKLDENETK